MHSDASTTAALVCAQCGSPISTAEELCTERVDTFARAVYAYELDVLDEEATKWSANFWLWNKPYHFNSRHRQKQTHELQAKWV